jgi:ABC-type sugar transport system permease subunit
MVTRFEAAVRRNSLQGLWFVLPFFIVLAVFQAYPVIDTLVTSFTDANLNQIDQVVGWVGLQNYLSELKSELFSQALVNTLVISAFSMLGQIGLALLITGLVTSQDLKLKGRGAWQVIFFAPSQITVSIIAVYIVFVFGYHGVLNQILHADNRGAYTDFFGSAPQIWGLLVGGTVFVSFGLTAYLLINSVQSIPRPVFEAARIDGASGRQVFWRIILPHLQPMLLFVVVLSLIFDLSMFDLPWGLFGGGAREPGGLTLITYAYQRGLVWDFDLGSASAVTTLVFLLIAALSALYFRIMKRTQEELSLWN